MTKFITLDMFLEQNKRKAASTHRMEEVPFVEWKVGHVISHKSNGGQFKIKSVEGEGSNYAKRFEIVNVDDETRSLKGGTLQSTYSFVSKGDVHDPAEDAPPANTKKLTMNVDHIRSFANRKHGEPGGRIVISDRISYIVTQDHAAITALVKSAEDV